MRRSYSLVSAIRDALPALRRLLDDHQRTTFGNQVPVADAARAAITKLETN
jgi:hypothetical protein